MSEKICGNCGTCSYKGRNLNFDIPEKTASETGDVAVENVEDIEVKPLTEAQKEERTLAIGEAAMQVFVESHMTSAMTTAVKEWLTNTPYLEQNIRLALGYAAPQGVDPNLISPRCSEDVLNLVLDAASRAMTSTVESALSTTYMQRVYAAITKALDAHFPQVDTDKILIREEGAAPTEYEILRFISSFAEAEDFFTLGKCYWFAQILNTRFRGGTIYYAPVDNHWIVKIGDYYYDASGKVKASTFQNLTKWTDYKKQEPKHARRLLKQCACYDWSDYGG